MAATTTKTLEVTLAPPTAHKERKLCDLLETYREGIHEVFDAGCDMMSATSDVMTPYDLPYQAKAALCNYVLQLHDTYNAQELVTTPTLLSVFVRNGQLDSAVANSSLDAISEARSWETNQ